METLESPAEQQLELKDAQLPEVKEWTVGNTYQVTLTIKQVKAEVEGEGVCAKFDIVKVESAKPVKEKKEKPTEDVEPPKEDPMIKAYEEENS